MGDIAPITVAMLTADHLLTVVDAYRAAREVSDSRVSALLFNDGKRIRMLREGGDIGSRHLVVAFQWLSDHWPDKAEWPSDITRPAQSPEAIVSAPEPVSELPHDTPCPQPVGLTTDVATEAA